MAMTHPGRFAKSSAGTYLSIFASAYVCLFLGALMAEQMGAARAPLAAIICAIALVAFAGAGAVAIADDGHDFFTAGRAIAPYFSGLSLALSTIGGTGIVCITGALFKIGIDALLLPIGWITGLVLAGVLLYPFLRKCGAYTIPSFLGLRLDSRIVRMVTALVLIVPTVLVLGAELRVGALLASWMTGQPEAMMLPMIAVAATLAVVTGGMRALTWSTTAQAVAILLALAVPATIVSLLISNLPIPQLTHGSLLRAFSRIEATQTFAAVKMGAGSFHMPGADLEAFTGPYLQSFGHVGRLALPLAILVIATGLAGLPATLNRAGTTASTYDTRKSVGWAVLTAAFMLLTLASVAGFMRGYLSEQVVNAPGDRLPVWFQTLQQLGFAEVSKTRAAVALNAILIKRDVAFLALPMAAGMPQALVALAAAGALAAAMAGAAAHIVALGGMLSEDLLHGGRREAPEDRLRLWSARLAVGVAGGSGMVVALAIYDPLGVVLAALALSSATVFPVLVLSILWRKVSRLGAVGGMLAGGGVTLVLMTGSVSGLIAMAPVLAAAIGGPVNVIVMVLVSQASPLATRRALEVVREVRLPGGEAIYDREMRLLRRKRNASAHQRSA